MNGVISVIIPVYNVAAYLRECMESVLTQDHRQLEVIVIDDGSTDGSGDICDGYAAADSRVTVIHQPNRGAAAAKNAGLQAARGEYLSFVDSDDRLEPGAYSHMLRLLRESGADIVQCSHRDVFRDHTDDRILSSGKTELDAADYLSLLTKDWTCTLLWDKLFRRSLFDGILFETGHKIDDEYFTYRGIMNAKRVLRDDRVVYNYRRRVSGVMLSPDSARQIVSDRIDFLSKRRVNVIARFPQLRAEYDSHFLEMMIILSRDEAAGEEHISEIRRQLKAYFREKGHTAPERRLLPALAKLMLCRTERLLRRRGVTQPSGDEKMLFE